MCVVHGSCWLAMSAQKHKDLLWWHWKYDCPHFNGSFRKFAFWKGYLYANQFNFCSTCVSSVNKNRLWLEIISAYSTIKRFIQIQNNRIICKVLSKEWILCIILNDKLGSSKKGLTLCRHFEKHFLLCYRVQVHIVSKIKQVWRFFNLCWFIIWKNNVEGKCLSLAIVGVKSWLMIKITSLMIIYQPQEHSPLYFGFVFMAK